ncbi:MAG: DUF3795 domain-containing protein [Candidatus Bathyarchaeia archaeon]
MENQLGCCGLNCEECPVFIATANDDYGLRQSTAVAWSKLYESFLEKPLESGDMNCKGCRSQDSLFVGCTNCPIRKCCGGKNLSTCGGCAEYDTCEMLNGFFSYGHQRAKENLDRMRTR